jgi:hypothetical protein
MRLPLAAALLVAASAAAAAPATAQQRTITVTLFGGKVITIDVPPGTPLDQLQLPPLNSPVLSIVDSAAPVPLPAPAPAAPLAPVDTPQLLEPDALTAASKHDKQHAKHQRAHKQAKLAAPATTPPAHAQTRARRKATLKRAADGTPRPADPTFSYAIPGPAPVGVPNFFIDRFRIPPFLLPIYQAAGIQYGVRWEILAAINEIETDYGRNLSTSTAGAVGWMQFMPASWRTYGVDANDDHKTDPYNPVDAIFSAARYLHDAGAASDVRRAIFDYNHADWYVDSVLMRARLIGGLPAELVGSLTGLTQGRFPLAAKSRYAAGKHAVNIFARAGAAAVAVQDARVMKVTRRTVQLRDVYGNTYTYTGLKQIAQAVPAPRKRALVARRLFAHPQSQASGHLRRLKVGRRVIAGSVIGRIGTLDPQIAPHLRFAIRPAGKGAPQIDPKPILDGWKLLESTAIYRAAGKNPLLGKNPSLGAILLMSKAQLQQRVLGDANVTLDEAGKSDVTSGQTDRRVLATLEFLSASGLKPTVSCLKTGHSLLTTSGNVSEHATGNAVDISQINGIPIIGHQGPGSITDITIRRLLSLQGTLKPHQIISLMTYEGADNTLSLPDHADHIHVGFQPDVATVIKPLQWTRLIDRLGEINNPTLTGEAS